MKQMQKKKSQEEEEDHLYVSCPGRRARLYLSPLRIVLSRMIKNHSLFLPLRNIVLVNIHSCLITINYLFN